MSTRQLFTAGYSGHTPESFLQKLQEHEVQVVVDVRDRPLSRKPGFSRSRLSSFLEDHDVEYKHLGELGVPKELRNRLRDRTTPLADYFDEFREYLDTQDESLDALHELAKQRTCCLMCLEARSDECHRSVVADIAAHRNGIAITILHL